MFLWNIETPKITRITIREFVVIKIKKTNREFGVIPHQTFLWNDDPGKQFTFRAKDELFLWNIETPKITRRTIREFMVIKKNNS